jgi:hypothetical protein
MPFVIKRASEQGKRTREALTNARGRTSAARKARNQYANDAIQDATAARIDKNTARQAARLKARELKAAAKARR